MFMDIPVMPVRSKGMNIVSSHITFSGTSISMTDETVGYSDLMSSLTKVCGKETPILAVDVKGVQKKDITPDLLRRIRSKHELWLMTGIRNAGDVMDAFHGDINKLVVPYHLTSDAALKDMMDISDCCIPAVFAGDDGVVGKGKGNDIARCVRTLERMNFRKVIVFDVLADDDARIWNGLRDLTDLIIPYVPSGMRRDADALHDMGFTDVLVSAIKYFQDVSKRSEIQNCMLP